MSIADRRSSHDEEVTVASVEKWLSTLLSDPKVSINT
jgi:hypothetical protein